MQQFNATEMKELNAALQKAFEAMGEQTKVMRAEILELQQKGAYKPGGYESKDLNALAEMVTKDAGFEQLRTGRIRDLKIPITGGFKNWIVNASGASQPLVPADRDKNIVFPANQPLRIRDLIPVLQTSSNSVEYPSEASYTNAAAPQGGPTSPIGAGESELFAESAFTFTLSSAAVITLGHVAIASQQILDDAQVLGQFLTNRLLYGLKLVEEAEILTGTGAAGALNGLNNQAAAFTGGATNQTLLDTLAKAKTQLELSNYTPDGVVLSPTDFLTMATAKDSQNRYLWGDPKANTPPSVWNVPIVVSNSQTIGRFLMADFKQACTIWDRSEAMVEFSTSHSDFFQRHLVMLKCWERLTLTVPRTTAMVYGLTQTAG